MNTTPDLRLDPARLIRPPRGNQKSCQSWLTEAAFRMLQNNLDPEVAEHPHALVVYGGIGRAARNWPAFDQRRWKAVPLKVTVTGFEAADLAPCAGIGMAPRTNVKARARRCIRIGKRPPGSREQ